VLERLARFVYSTYLFRWGQIYILDSLLRYVPERHADAEIMAERVVVQLQHANSAVVLTTIKALLYLMNYMENRRLIEYCCKKMGPPLGQSKDKQDFLVV
jgi:AP-2 complex subunit beta-1